MSTLRWANSKFQQDETTGGVVAIEVAGAVSTYRDEVEELRAQVQQLICIVSVMADSLPPDAQRRLVDSISYGCKEVTR